MPRTALHRPQHMPSREILDPPTSVRDLSRLAATFHAPVQRVHKRTAQRSAPKIVIRRSHGTKLFAPHKGDAAETGYMRASIISCNKDRPRVRPNRRGTLRKWGIPVNICLRDQLHGEVASVLGRTRARLMEAVRSYESAAQDDVFSIHLSKSHVVLKRVGQVERSDIGMGSDVGARRGTAGHPDRPNRHHCCRARVETRGERTTGKPLSRGAVPRSSQGLWMRKGHCGRRASRCPSTTLRPMFQQSLASDCPTPHPGDNR